MVYSLQKPNQDSEFQVVERGSEQYRAFVRQRIEGNFATTSGCKQSACLLCWAFITPTQKRRHLEHEPYIVTASFFKNEESFIKLCRENGKLSGNQQRIILFKETCQFANLSLVGHGSAEVHGGANAGRSSIYAGGMNPVTNLQEISKKQFEFDFQIKRITTVANNLREEFKGTDKKLCNMETQVGILKQQVASFVQEKQMLQSYQDEFDEQ